MKNRDIYLKDPVESRLVNQGVVEVVEPRSEQELRTLRWELENFCCDGQYGRGIERILSTYLASLDREEQPAVWVSGFYGSGKSHFAKMLRFLWTDYQFSDRASARGIAPLPDEIRAQLRELSTQGKRLGGLHAAGGKLGAGAGESARLALLGIVFRSIGLPEDYAAGRFVLFLRRNGYLDAVRRAVEKAGRNWDRELNDLYVSPVLAKAILDVHPRFASGEEKVLEQIALQFPRPSDISDADMTLAVEEALAPSGKVPCTLIALDEVQQYIADSSDRAYRVQELAEACAKRFGARIVFLGTGQTALTATPQLQKLQARFRLAVELSDADVDTVVRKIVLAKKVDKVSKIEQLLKDCSGEISRQLAGTKLASRPEDDEVLVADYPLLPVRRRFWEKAMRAVDPTGTRAELRNQLTNVFEAVRATAEKSLGNVVPADFLYDQNKTQLVQTGALLREIQEVIERLADGTEAGRLKSRLCALCFLIGKLPRDPGADVGVRATSDTLADLLVEDLAAGSSELRKRIPPLLAVLAESGILIQVGEEYRLQTRESAAWESEYKDRLNRILNNEGDLAAERSQLLRGRVGEALKGLKLPHGQSKVLRKLDLSFSQEKPSADGPNIPIWVRDGWRDAERSVLADARAAGSDSPLVVVYLPRQSAEDLRRHVASSKAARETVNAKGNPTTPEGMEARTGMDTRRATAEQQRDAILDEVLSSARVFLAGGAEKIGISLAGKVREAAEDALQRLYPHFNDADDPRWGKVVERARNGAPDALEAVGHTGKPEDHKVCKAVLSFVAGGKKGRDIRKHFVDSSGYGWPQDAIDGALIVLVGSGHLRATHDGKPLGQKQLDQGKIGVIDFRLESTTVTVQQRLELRKLFQGGGVPAAPNEEAGVAHEYLDRMRSLAKEAGGEAPLPLPPSTQKLDELAAISGNEQLVALYEARDELSRQHAEWTKRKNLITRRKSRWSILEQLFREAMSLPTAAEITPQIEALRTNRAVLNDPDPVPPLCGQLSNSLRVALRTESGEYANLRQELMQRISETHTWKRLSDEQRAAILNRQSIAGVPEIRVGNEQELLASLSEISLESWATRRDALPQRFAKAVEEAVKIIEPEAIRVALPSATIRNEAELRTWLTEVEYHVREQLGKGPVIV